MIWVALRLRDNSIHLSKPILPMKNRFRTLLVTTIMLTFQYCTALPTNSEVPGEQIEVKPGPEDMVIDTLHGYPRLLISCSGRREAHKPYGEIIS